MMITERARPFVRPLTRYDRQQLASLIHFETRVHRHLDWRHPLDWLGYTPYLALEQEEGLAAVLACPPDPAEIAWIRIFAVSSRMGQTQAWEELWPAALAMLKEMPQVEQAAAIPLQAWFSTLLEASGFKHTHDVVVLSWEGSVPPTLKLPPGVRIRPMVIEDLPVVAKLDQAAFDPVWNNSQDALDTAFQQATVATVAELHGEPVAYQISTANPLGGHLARLAVLPDAQGNGIGSALVDDLLRVFSQRGAQYVTVNTQHNNLASLAVYKKAGFKPTGESYPVYQLFLIG